jgi:5-methyltetrahydrofolate--homocysteine methyltransferase
MDDAKERLKAFWDHELIDRPCISYRYPIYGKKLPKGTDVIEYFFPWFMAKNWDDIQKFLKDFEDISKCFYFGGECIPRLWPNYGPGIMASVLGVEPEFNPNSKTVWFHRETNVDDIIPLLESVKLNRNNPWYDRLLRITEYAAKHAGKDYCVAVTDLGGVLDILSSFLGPTKIILTMKRQPEIIDTCRVIILEKLLKVYDDLQIIIERYGDGCSAWLDIWCSKRWYPIQSDFTAFLSPEWFKRFALPDIIAQAEHMDYAIYHLDGPDALKHLDALLTVDSITGIQWVPGAGRKLACSDAWMPVYKKIQSTGKIVIIYVFERPKPLSHFYKVLDPKFLFPVNISIDPIKAQFYLPKFVGGQGGSGNFRIFKRSMRKHLKNKNA